MMERWCRWLFRINSLPLGKGKGVCVLIIVSGAITLVSFLLWFGINSLETKQIEKELDLVASNLQVEVEKETQQIISVLTNLAHQKIDQQTQAKLITASFPAIEAIALVEPEKQLRYLSPEASETIVTPLIYKWLPTSQQITISPSFDLKEQKKGFLIYIPTKKAGYIVGVVYFEGLLGKDKNYFNAYKIDLLQNKQVIYLSVQRRPTL
jgi:hypothetical protein